MLEVPSRPRDVGIGRLPDFEQQLWTRSLRPVRLSQCWSLGQPCMANGPEITGITGGTERTMVMWADRDAGGRIGRLA